MVGRKVTLPAAFPKSLRYENERDDRTEIRGGAFPEREEWLLAKSSAFEPLHRWE